MTEYKQYQLTKYLEVGAAPNEKTLTIATVKTPELQDGDVLLKIEYLSVDPYMRGRMTDGVQIMNCFPLNADVPTLGLGQVVESKNEKIKIGEYYSGFVSLSEYHVSKGGQNLTKIDPSVPLHLYLSVFGMTGATSYYGTVGVLEVKEGDVFVVNAASGACGTVAGRIAKLRGAFVVGITSEGSKGDHIKKQFGFDEVINYKDYPTFDEFYKILKEKCPNGIDKYFDNVGGYQTDAVLKLLNKNGRIAICGQISYYNTQPYFPQFSLMETIYKTIRIEGFLVGDFFTKPEFGNYLKEMSEWVKTGQLVADDTIFKGFEEIPNAFLSLFTGNKVGKVIIQLSESK